MNRRSPFLPPPGLAVRSLPILALLVVSSCTGVQVPVAASDPGVGTTDTAQPAESPTPEATTAPSLVRATVWSVEA